MRANRFAARKARPFNNYGGTIVKQCDTRIHKRISKSVSGTAERPRLAIHFSGKHVYAQVIDDDAGRTLVAAATTEKDFRGKGKAAANRADGGSSRQSDRRTLARQRRSTRSFSIAADFSITEK